jgi:hypothetical protein
METSRFDLGARLTVFAQPSSQTSDQFLIETKEAQRLESWQGLQWGKP